MKAHIVDYLFVRNGKGRLTIDLEDDFRQQYDKFKDTDIDISIKKFSDPRTLRANAYLWTLIGEIGNRMRLSKEEVYFDMLKAYGQVGAVSVQKKWSRQFERTNKYIEYLGESELNGEPWRHYKFWIGSHEYSKDEFSILLDGVIQEAKQLGIETRPSEEIDSMLKELEHGRN